MAAAAVESSSGHTPTDDGVDDSEDASQCALCRLPCDADAAEMTFGYVGMILPTNLPTKLQLSAPAPFPPVAWTDASGAARPTVCGDTIAWTCGHAVHHACIKAYLVSLWKQRSSRHAMDALAQHGDDRLLSERDMEFLCPICRRLSNFVLPDVSGLRGRLESPQRSPSLKALDDGRQAPSTPLSAGSTLASDVCGFAAWLQRGMNAPVSLRRRVPAPASTDLESAIRSRVRKFGRHMKLRAVRTTLLLPMTLARDDANDVAVDEEIRRRADAWSATVPHWQWLLRSLRVSVDVAQHERELLELSPTRPLDKHRFHSLQLLMDAAVVASLDDSSWDVAVERSSSVLFGRRVLFAEDDADDENADDEDDASHSTAQDSGRGRRRPSAASASTSATSSLTVNVPLLANQSLCELFLCRMLWVRAQSLSSTADDTSSSLETSNAEHALADALYSMRLIVTAAILQAMGALCVSAWDDDSAAMSPATPSRRGRPITDFGDVESLRDAMSWMHHLLSRTRFVSSDGSATAREPPRVRPRRWDVGEIEERVVAHCLPLLRRLLLVFDLCFARRATASQDTEWHAAASSASASASTSVSSENEPCAVCDEIFTASVQDDGPAQLAELQSYLRRLHLPPLRLFFRPHVFTAGQRELCQLWGAQIESQAAVLRRRRDRLPLPQQPRSLLPLTPAPSRRLIMPLPRVYMELFIKYNERPTGLCQRCRQLPQHPAICLLCGQVLCCFSPCCESTRGRIGECTQHTQACGLGTGAYLLLRACTVILFIGNERRCVWGSLYVDKNGEEDPYLRRGKTLYLAPTRLLRAGGAARVPQLCAEHGDSRQHVATRWTSVLIRLG
ncbi:hypothetical protein PINS_up011093 [Pythium insidiosum]|nr:hypothetical protein PINS_up011093 [Pythium insidiosum]